MKKIYALAAMLGMAAIAHAQNPEIKSELPTILPPSPTVAALMKFEEVPVSNYTGVPDISIPLLSTPTQSKDISLDISLKYNSSGIGADAIASDVGLGWSLFAGGTISRTVRGMPDEIEVLGNSAKIGLYQNSTQNHVNNYYQVLQILNDENSSVADQEIANEYLWDAQVKGILDTEHDLWQFNFMGHSGRFYIQKNTVTGQLEVKGLDDNRLKIVNHYTPGTYAHTDFIIYDEKGYQFIFDIVEKTASNSISTIISWDDEIITHNPTALMNYNSAFHLSKILDNQNNILAEFNYNPTPIKEIALDGSQTLNIQDYLGNTAYSISYYAQMRPNMYNFSPLPKEVITWSQRNTDVKKLLNISVNGIAKIDFNYEKGRQDTNLDHPDLAYVFKGIVIKDWKNNPIKKFTLEQGYSYVTKVRMILKKVHMENFNDTKKETRELFYKTNNQGDNSIGKDYWGYFNLRPNCSLKGIDRKTNPVFCTTDVLCKMTLPTGGCVMFDFESNRYSSIGNTAITNFDDNPDNWSDNEISYYFTTQQRTPQNLLFSATQDQKVTFYPSTTATDAEYKGFTIYKNGVAQVGALYCPDTIPGCCIEYVLEAGAQYSIGYWYWLIGQSDSDNVKAVYHNRISDPKQFLYGGGIRIKRIDYFDTSNIPENFYEQYPDMVLAYPPKKELNYSYNSFGQPLKSSGALAFPVPKFEYRKSKRECTWRQVSVISRIDLDDQTTFFYDTYTTTNNLQSVRTQGADVGYSNVKVFETGNGYSEYEYTSPLDYPEAIDQYVTAPPFIPTLNIDYKRGLLKKERIFDANSRKLNETLYDYEFVDYKEITGFRPFYLLSEFTQGFIHYDYYYQYKNYLASCSINNNCFCDFGRVPQFIFFRNIEEGFGWAKLINKTTKSFFYSGSVQTEVGTSESYAYNALNKKIASQTTTLGTGEVLKTDFYYHAGNSPYSQNRISEIERVDSYRNSELLSTSRIVYSNAFAGNAAWLPQAVQASKGANALEAKVRYNSYDQYGHPLEVQQENGMKVSYVWGYSRTQPVAKIDNMAYASLPAGLVTAVQNASDAAPFNNTAEASLLSALEDLRIAATASGGQMTGYAYRPLVGVSAVIDPKGDRTYYEYDGFGRLKAAYDRNGKLLSENEYHYRTQN
ncbi:hypothetical protein MH928_02740 [Flavobacterium sp. WW92]|uniref:hypothetical protein n=1 Tax=unclassified Flavobacterium TaxID=196869 RepID=UPI00222400CE|nr:MULTISPECIES: hypothetical protein [unclassified Flavobacterium]WDO13627.1 hypothetical protein MH928_02740 [Flavobacterium sp. WW92]